MMKPFVAHLIAAFYLLTLPGLATAQSEPPLPPDLAITPAGADVPPERAKYLGAWTGQLDGDGMKVIYAVTRIDADRAHVYYGFGAFAPSFVHAPGAVRFVGKFTPEGSIFVKSPNGAYLTATLKPNGNLKFSWQRGGPLFVGDLQPLKLPASDGAEAKTSAR